MGEIIVEHVNISVAEPVQLAERLCTLFQWQIRWQGASLEGGYTVHVGGKHSYLALYSPPELAAHAAPRYVSPNGLNHVGVVVDNIEQVRTKLNNEGLAPHSENHIAPGHRLYFNCQGLEFEVVQY